MIMSRVSAEPDVWPGVNILCHATVQQSGEWSSVAAGSFHLARDWIAHDTDTGSWPPSLVEFRFPNGPGRELFPQDLVRTYQHVTGPDNDLSRTCLLYLHAGYQAQAKTPLLQTLLQILDYRGPAYAIRLRSGSFDWNEFDFVRVLLTTYDRCLLVTDPTERLARSIKQTSLVSPIAFTWLARTTGTGPKTCADASSSLEWSNPPVAVERLPHFTRSAL